MIKILFVCHGNICRSPMAEYICKKMAADRGVLEELEISSAATSREEIGNGVYPPARRKLNSVGISCDGHRARQVTKADYDHYDYLIVMEQYNIRNLMRIIGSDSEKKVYKLLDFAESGGDIDDPWYTGDFDTTYREIVEGLEGFFEKAVD
ncbi:low molecular weight protein-tyrosine-phosphatase [Lachnospiraceae bacterium 38-10]